MPEPLAAVVIVNILGLPPEQIVWLLAKTPALTLLTSILNGFETAVQAIPFNVLLVITW